MMHRIPAILVLIGLALLALGSWSNNLAALAVGGLLCGVAVGLYVSKNVSG
jgi:uncharacterized membrane protein